MRFGVSADHCQLLPTNDKLRTVTFVRVGRRFDSITIHRMESVRSAGSTRRAPINYRESVLAWGLSPKNVRRQRRQAAPKPASNGLARTPSQEGRNPSPTRSRCDERRRSSRARQRGRRHDPDSSRIREQLVIARNRPSRNHGRPGQRRYRANERLTACSASTPTAPTNAGAPRRLWRVFGG
jgi:hypothetical protein